MKAIGIAVMLMLFSSHAQADTWRMAAAGPSGAIGVETENLIDRGNEKLVWTLMVGPGSLSESMTFAKRRIRVNCADQTYTEVALSGYGEDGQFVANLDPDPATKSYIPGSVAWGEFSAVCTGTWDWGDDTFSSSLEFVRFARILIEIVVEELARDRH